MITFLLLISKPEVNSCSVTVVLVPVSPGVIPFPTSVTVRNVWLTVVVADRFSAVRSSRTVVVVVVVLVIVVRTMCFNSSGC